MELALISSRKKVSNEAQVITDLFRSGLMIYHLRKNHYSRRDHFRFIRSIPQEFHNRIISHNYPGLAFKFKLKGIHFSSRQLYKSNKLFIRILLRIFKPGISISRGFDNLSDLISNKKKYNFVVLNPVFDSVSEDINATAFSAKAIQSAVENSKHKVFGLGGVKIENLEFLKSMGFAGGIFNTSIWEVEGDSIKAFKRALHEVNRISESEGVIRRMAI